MNEEESDIDYYHRRAAEELAKANSAADPALATKHRQLFSIYTSRALQAERKREAEESEGPARPRNPAADDRGDAEDIVP